MKKYDFFAHDTVGNKYTFEEEKSEHGIVLTLKKENIKAISNIYALGEFTAAKTGDEGFYAIPRNIKQRGDILTVFEKRQNCIHKQQNPLMSFFGLKKKDLCCLVRVERNYLSSFDVTVEDDVYKLEVVFELENEYIDPATAIPPEDIRIEIIFLDPNSDFNNIARKEREIRLVRNEIIPLTEKCKREAVEYARKYPLVRIRQGWKPSPSPIKHQTLENEPPMYVACDFKRVRELADEFKRQGIEGAEFQLVGWNVSGHDGRFLQIFPAEEKLGGDEGLFETIKYIKSLGYRISTHTNLQDSYEISDSFSWDEIAIDKEGKSARMGDYSAGYAYYLCPDFQLKYAERDYPKLCEFGENGVHFTDVMSITTPPTCHSSLHPSTFKHGIESLKKSMEYQRELFGAFSSEGAMDFAIKNIDFALYVSFGDGFGHFHNPVTSEFIHMWEVVYHGTVLYNPTSPTVNYPVKTPIERLSHIMCGGRPTMYFYSKFRSNGAKNWMGDADLTCDTDDDMRKSVSMVKSSLEDYKPLSYLQLIYMDRYDIIGDGIEVATYENGVRIAGNFSDVEKSFEGRRIPPFDYVLIERNYQ